MVVLAGFNPPVIVDGELKSVNAGSYVSSLGDISCEMNITDVLQEWEKGSFTAIRKRSNIGFTRVCYWMQFQVLNTSGEKEVFYIEIPNPELEDVSLYVFNDSLQRIKYISTGNKYPFKQREVEHRNFLFELETLPESTYLVFLRVDRQANYVNVPIKIWSRDYKNAVNQKLEYRLGMFYGIMLLYIFIMALMSYFLLDMYYFYYTILLALGIFFIFINEGLAFQFIWPRNPWLQGVMRYLILNAYLLFSTLFVENFIRDKLPYRLSLNFLRACLAFLVLLTLVILFYPTLSIQAQFTISIIISIVIIVVHMLFMALLYYGYKRSHEKGLIFFQGAFFISFGIIIFFTLIKFGLLPVNIDSSRAIYIGGAAVGIIFTFLFSFRVRSVIRSNKELRTELGLAGTKYSFALLEGQEKERKRVADELHDGIGIKMSALKMKLSNLDREGADIDHQMMSRIIEQVDHSCASIRSMSHSLVPRNLERYGLLAAINDLIEDIGSKHRTKIIFRQRRLAEAIDGTSKLALYRLVEGMLLELVRRKVEQVTLKLVIIPSIQQASINFKYIGRRVEFGVNRNLENVRSIVQVLNGQVRWTMDTMWSNQVDMEIPVVGEKMFDPDVAGMT
jgi:signal transduction histidine kinase